MNTGIAKLVFVGLATALMAVPAGGQETGESCAAIGDDAQRLACYDGIFRGDVAPPEGAIELISEQLIPARPSGRGNARVTMACLESGLEVRMAFAGQQLSATGSFVPITFQTDQGATRVRTMTPSPSNTEATFGSAMDRDGFLDSLSGGTTLRVRLTPQGGRSLTVTFRVAELLDEIDALRASCP